MEVEKKETSFNFKDFKNQAISNLKTGKGFVGKDGILTPLIKEFLEAVLEGEMTSHMATCLEEPEHQNRRNVKSSKTMQSPMGFFELVTLRDREVSFILR